VDDSDAFFDALSRPLLPSFRVNRLKASVDNVRAQLNEYGIECRPVPWNGDALTTTSTELSTSLEHYLGHVYMQELASMLPALIIQCELRGAQLVLDACAAPGSKTTQMAAFMDNHGCIVANDIDFRRIRALKHNCNTAGVMNVAITNRAIADFKQESFDIVLLDAPCTSDGTVRKNPKTLRSWSVERIWYFAEKQKSLISLSYDLLRPGGLLVYSTCAFAPEENEEVVNHLLREQPAHLEPISLPNFMFSPAVEAWEGMRFHPDVSHAVRVWPHINDTSGFFIARIRK
jgi:NOL1/NOP2/sun family putative RNA methylase